MGTLSAVGAPPFERLGVVGLGFVGGSVALAAKRCWPSLTVTVCDPAATTVEAVTQGLATAQVTSPAELADCDLIVVATPVQMVPGVLKTLSDAGVRGLVTDVSSTKRTIMKAAGACRLVFVGGHPVIDAHQSGLASARADLFDGKAWLLVSSHQDRAEETERAVIVTEVQAASPAVLEALLATFIVGLGGRPEWTDAVTHDRVMAHVRHAPQLITMALKPTPATPASPEIDEWQGIVATNADFVADALQSLAQKLPTSADVLTKTPVVRDVLERAQVLKGTR